MSGHRSSLAAVLVAAPLLAGCTLPAVVLLAQASPNPLEKQATLGLMPVDYTGLIIERQFFASMDRAAQTSWAEQESAIAADLACAFTDRATMAGLNLVKVTAAGSAPFMIIPRIEYIDGGGSRSDLRVRVRITTADGLSIEGAGQPHDPARRNPRGRGAPSRG